MYFYLPRMYSYGFTLIHRKDLHLTKIVFTIVLVFLLLNLPRLLLGMFEISRQLVSFDYSYFLHNFGNFRYSLMVACFNTPAGRYVGPEWQLLVDMLARYLAVLNSSINFIIYCVAGKQFRSILAGILHLMFGQVLTLL